MVAALVMHGHFYQPPREDPWTEQVPQEPSAAPFHDWNSRITAECYRPNAWARVYSGEGELIDLVSNYQLISFNVGPTLLSWLEEHAPDTYAQVILADRISGKAIAQAYGHAILPLCNDRDLRTQIRWGLADFRHRFGREPAGMWLPETAVDERVLAVLAEEGVKFTILAPHQVVPTDPAGSEPDDRGDRPPTYHWRHPQRADLGLDLVVYEGELAHDLAFDPSTTGRLIDRVLGLAGGDGSDGDRHLVTVACDGETFGHHQPFAERRLACALAEDAPRRQVELPRLASWLEDHPPKWEATVVTSSWSCAHGVGRWMVDCGCQTGGEEGWQQRWREPLRQALDILRDRAAEVFTRRGEPVLRDPWSARDAYIDVLLGAVDLDDFLAVHMRPGSAAKADATVEALTLLESQRHALAMYTSCGWFFNDLAGIETLQVLRYAARCIDLLEELDETPPRDEVLRVLEGAESNRPDEGDGRAIWIRHVEPRRTDARAAAGRLATLGLSQGDLAVLGTVKELDSFEVTHELLDRAVQGEARLVAGLAQMTHRRTRRVTTWVYGAIRVGEAEPVVGVRPVGSREHDQRIVFSLTDALRSGEPPGDVTSRLTMDLADPVA